MQRKLLFSAFLFFCVISVAQQYPFVHYTPKDGLANSRVKKAYQDSKGRMYFLTYGGLSMYDGARFKNYSTQNGLPNNVVNDVFEIGDDSLLVATNTNQLNLLTKGKIELFKTEDNFSPLVNQFYRHDNNQIYLSSDYGLFRLEKNKVHKLNIAGLTTISTDQPNLGNITGIGNYLVITVNDLGNHKGIYLYDIKNNRICDALPATVALLLGKDENSRIWLSSTQKLMIVDNVTLKNGKLSLESPDKGFREIENYSTINVALRKNSVWLIYRNEEYKNSELRRIDEKGDMLRMSLPGQALFANIRNIFIDRENSIWLCNDGEGVFKIVRSPLQIFEKPLGPFSEGQAGYAFYTNNITWYGTVTNKLYRKTLGSMKEYSCNLARSPYIFYDDGKIIIGKTDHNIYEASLNEKTNKISFRNIINVSDSVMLGKPVVDRYGAIISSANNKLSVWVNSKLIFQMPFNNEGIADIIIDKQNRLWAITRNSGIAVFDINPENFSKYLEPVFYISPDNILGSVRSFVIDRTGLIWIGTREHGLFAYQLKDKNLEKLFLFNTNNGLTDNFITSLAIDSLNNIILGTQTGLDRILRLPENSFRVENLSKNSNSYAYITTTWADANQAYALTFTGVELQVSTLASEKIIQAPQLLLEEIKINAKTILQHHTSFSHKENTISFFVAAPSFIDEKQIRYSYLLQGSGNASWSDTSSSNSIINLTNLSADNYILHVKAFFPSGTYSQSELNYSFEIRPPWWGTWWFRTIAAIFILGLLVMASRFYYRRKLEKQMSVLEKQQAIEKERTRIATDMHDDLGAGLSRIKFLSETIGIKKQQQLPIEEDISKIREYSHEMIDKMGEIVWALNEKNDSLSDLLSYSRAYAVEYLTQNGIKCTVETPDQFPQTFVSGEFRRNIYLTIKEALHNIVKHAQASEVVIEISINKNLYIRIKDDGTGFDKSKIRSFSNGLSNMELRIKEAGGQLDILSEGRTEIKIKVPLPV